MAFFRVVVICDCPTTVEKSWGLYFRAETINLSIRFSSYSKRTANTKAGNDRTPKFFTNEPNGGILFSKITICDLREKNMRSQIVTSCVFQFLRLRHLSFSRVHSIFRCHTYFIKYAK